jgi:hypothetical protein
LIRRFEIETDGKWSRFEVVKKARTDEQNARRRAVEPQGIAFNATTERGVAVHNGFVVVATFVRHGIAVEGKMRD